MGRRSGGVTDVPHDITAIPHDDDATDVVSLRHGTHLMKASSMVTRTQTCMRRLTLHSGCKSCVDVVTAAPAAAASAILSCSSDLPESTASAAR